MMGCFTVLRSRKKKTEHSVFLKPVAHREHTPTALPEPRVHTRSLQLAPLGFRTRVKPYQVNNETTRDRTHTLYAPSCFDAAKEEGLASAEFEGLEELKSHVELVKEPRSPSPQPLPLPSPPHTGLKKMGNFKSGIASGPLFASGPLPLPPCESLRNFSHEEIATACDHFSSDRCTSEGLSSVLYKASFGDDASSSKKFEATVTNLHPSSQGLREFIHQVNALASLQHKNLCKLLGYHARDNLEQRMLVYERLFHGSLDQHLYGRSDGPPIDWNTRMKIALCSAQGLTFLHEEGPFQIDKDFSAKLSGYGCVGHMPETEEISANSVAGANLSVETLERGWLTPKSNVWSFGIVLLELLTGRKNLDNRHPWEERNLVKWSRPYLADDCRLSLIMDSNLKGRFPMKGARSVADIAQRCLQKDPSERPTMRTIVENLKIIQDMKYSCLFPLQEPLANAGKQISGSPSLNGSITPAPGSIFSPSPTTPPTSSLTLPPRACSSTLSLQELELRYARRSSSESLTGTSLEGF